MRLAAEGADIVVCDLAADIASVPFALATPSDLNETVRLVEDQGRRCIGVIADVRETAAMQDLATAP